MTIRHSKTMRDIKSYMARMQGSGLIIDMLQDDVAKDNEAKDKTLGAVDVNLYDIIRPKAP